MAKTTYKEIWQKVEYDFPYKGEIQFEFSNFGTVRSLSLKTYGQILKGAMVDGCRSIKLKYLTERPPAAQKRIDFLREQRAKLIRQIGKYRTRNKAKRIKDKSYHVVEEKIEDLTLLLEGIKAKYYSEFRAIELKRTINKSYLVHRLVAESFVDKPSPAHNLVIHLDHDKLNNHYTNLKWVTQNEIFAHQMTNPKFVAARLEREPVRNENTKVYKLTSTKVMLIKKKINEGVKLRALAKSFKVTETQLLRIKRGENWGHVQPAK